MEKSDFLKRLERDLIKKDRSALWSPFTKAVRDYSLINEGDRVAVCISGGKDSFLLAKLIQELQCHGPIDFEAIYLSMDPGYAKRNRELIEKNASLLDIPVTFFSSDIFENVDVIEKNPCYICARMRRGCLYSRAKAMGANKIALGHHFDDVIETILMGMLYGGQFQTMMPKLRSNNFEGMELIRPLYYVREDDIKKWRDSNDLLFLRCACRFTERNDNEEDPMDSKRLETKKIIRELKKTNPYIEKNIFKSAQNVNLKTVLAYKSDGVKHFFTDDY